MIALRPYHQGDKIMGLGICDLTQDRIYDFLVAAKSYNMLYIWIKS